MFIYVSPQLDAIGDELISLHSPQLTGVIRTADWKT